MSLMVRSPSASRQSSKPFIRQSTTRRILTSKYIQHAKRMSRGISMSRSTPLVSSYRKAYPQRVHANNQPSSRYSWDLGRRLLITTLVDASCRFTLTRSLISSTPFHLVNHFLVQRFIAGEHARDIERLRCRSRPETVPGQFIVILEDGQRVCRHFIGVP